MSTLDVWRVVLNFTALISMAVCCIWAMRMSARSRERHAKANAEQNEIWRSAMTTISTGIRDAVQLNTEALKEIRDFLKDRRRR